MRAEEKKVDIVLKGQETSRNEIQFGAGYSGFDGFFGQFSFQTRNFLGRGEIIGVSAQLGKISNYFDLSYTIPWFMDKNQSVGASLFRRKVVYASQTEQRQGGTLFYGKGHRALRFGLAALLVPGHHGELPGPRAPRPRRASRRRRRSSSRRAGTTSSLTPAYRYDSRNDPMNPTQGFRLFAAVEIAPAFFGGTNAFIKPTIGSTIYIPVRFPRNALLAFNVEIGFVHARQRHRSAGLRAVPARRRAEPARILAGRRSCRCTRRPTIVFTDEDGRILGGNKFFVINVEYQFLTVGPATLLAFVDFGNNYYDTQTFEPRRTSARRSAWSCGSSCPSSRRPCGSSTPSTCTRCSRIDQFGFPIQNLTEKKSGFTFSIGRTF